MPGKGSFGKTVLGVVAGLVVLLIAGVLIAPSFVDWKAYKGQIAAAVRDATGRELTIAGDIDLAVLPTPALARSEEHTSELQSLMRISYAVFCLKKKKKNTTYLKTNIFKNKLNNNQT